MPLQALPFYYQVSNRRFLWHMKFITANGKNFAILLIPLIASTAFIALEFGSWWIRKSFWYLPGQVKRISGARTMLRKVSVGMRCHVNKYYSFDGPVWECGKEFFWNDSYVMWDHFSTFFRSLAKLSAVSHFFLILKFRISEQEFLDNSPNIWIEKELFWKLWKIWKII